MDPGGVMFIVQSLTLFSVRRLILALVLALGVFYLTALPAAADGPCCYMLPNSSMQSADAASTFDAPVPTVIYLSV